MILYVAADKDKVQLFASGEAWGALCKLTDPFRGDLDTQSSLKPGRR